MSEIVVFFIVLWYTGAMDKQTKRDLKKTRKQIYIFLAIAFPVILVGSFLLYHFFPSLRQNEPIVVIIMVALGGIMFFVYQLISAKREAKKLKESKNKFDPYAD